MEQFFTGIEFNTEPGLCYLQKPTREEYQSDLQNLKPGDGGVHVDALSTSVLKTWSRLRSDMMSLLLDDLVSGAVLAWFDVDQQQPMAYREFCRKILKAGSGKTLVEFYSKLATYRYQLFRLDYSTARVIREVTAALGYDPLDRSLPQVRRS